MQRRSRIVLIVAGFAVTSLRAAESSPLEGLPVEDARTLIEYLGEGVVVRSVAAGPMDDPSRWFPFASSTLTYRVTGGSDKGSTEQHVYRGIEDGVAAPGWSEAVGDYQTLFLSRSAAGDILIRGEITHDRNKVSLFSPGEPLIPIGIEPGETREEQSQVEVFALGKPDRVKYSGTVRVTCTYLGAYEIQVPAGRYFALLFKWTDDGKVGPANVGEVEYRFLAEGVGTVAQVVLRSVDAWLVYRSHTRIGKVLERREGP